MYVWYIYMQIYVLLIVKCRILYVIISFQKTDVTKESIFVLRHWIEFTDAGYGPNVKTVIHCNSYSSHRTCPRCIAVHSCRPWAIRFSSAHFPHLDLHHLQLHPPPPPISVFLGSRSTIVHFTWHSRNTAPSTFPISRHAPPGRWSSLLFIIIQYGY